MGREFSSINAQFARTISGLIELDSANNATEILQKKFHILSNCFSNIYWNRITRRLISPKITREIVTFLSTFQGTD